MKGTKRAILLVIGVVFCSCSTKIRPSNLEGYYEYLRLDPDTYRIADIVRTKVLFRNYAADGLPIVDMGLLNTMLVTKDSLVGLWDVDEIDGKSVPEYYAYTRTKLKAGDSWGKDWGNRFQVKFECLATDTIIEVNQSKIEIAALVRMITKNEGWEISEVGYDQNFKIAYYMRYLKFFDNSMTPKLVLVLNKYHPKSEFRDSLSIKTWLEQYPFSLDHRLDQLPETETIDSLELFE